VGESEVGALSDPPAIEGPTGRFILQQMAAIASIMTKPNGSGHSIGNNNALASPGSRTFAYR